MFTSLRAASSVIRGPQRSYATLREIETRLKSIKNIEKITKTMKIVASTRLSKADKAKQTARKYSKADHGFYENAGTTVADEVTGNLIIAITSDKGLCGSIHSQLAKRVRSELNKTPEAKVVAIGDKIKGQLLRSHAKNMLLSISGVGKEAPNFDESALIADQILRKAGNNFNKITVYYNSPLSSLSFEPSTKPVYNVDAIEKSPLLSKYEIDADVEVSQDLFEYTLANQIYSAMADGYSAEISARRNAMDNASKNAGDMINRYSILYNRTRQAVITNELVDIITGASSLD